MIECLSGYAAVISEVGQELLDFAEQNAGPMCKFAAFDYSACPRCYLFGVLACAAFCQFDFPWKLRRSLLACRVVDEKRYGPLNTISIREPCIVFLRLLSYSLTLDDLCVFSFEYACDNITLPLLSSFDLTVFLSPLQLPKLLLFHKLRMPVIEYNIAAFSLVVVGFQ